MQKLIMNAEHYPLNNCKTNGLDHCLLLTMRERVLEFIITCIVSTVRDFVRAIYKIVLNEQKRKRGNFLGNFKIHIYIL